MKRPLQELMKIAILENWNNTEKVKAQEEKKVKRCRATYDYHHLSYIINIYRHIIVLILDAERAYHSNSSLLRHLFYAFTRY